MSNEKCLFSIEYAGLGTLLRNAILGGIGAVVVTLLFYDNFFLIILLGSIFVLSIVLPYVFGLYSAKIEFYESGMKFLKWNRVQQEIQYSNVTRLGEEHYAYRRGYSLYGEGNKLIAILPFNPKKQELNGVRALDWLNAKIASTSS
ncbi:MAG: hypothetical protein ACYC7D_15730 [Nitrososphaerales archaeon]